MLTKWPPLKLAQLALLGSVLVGLWLPGLTIFEALKSQSHSYGPHQGNFATAVSILLFFAPMLIGALLIGMAQWRLFAGLDKDKWSEQEVEIAHRWIESPELGRIATWLLWTIRSVAIAALLYWGASYVWKSLAPWVARSPYFSLIWLLWLRIPLEILWKLRSTLRPEPPPRVPPKGWAGMINGIYSEHWGGRKSSNSERSEA
jgi:hypothetical protein